MARGALHTRLVFLILRTSQKHVPRMSCDANVIVAGVCMRVAMPFLAFLGYRDVWIQALAQPHSRIQPFRFQTTIRRPVK